MKNSFNLKKTYPGVLFLALTWLLFFCLALGSGVAEAASASCGAWSIIPSPNVGSGGNNFNAVAALSATNAWAVGGYTDPTTGSQQALIEHFNGSIWSVVASPNPSSNYADLFAVAAISATNVWAVGADNENGQALIEHYDGSSWMLVNSPIVGSGFISMKGIAALSAQNIWIVGINANIVQGTTQTITEHYNGSIWSVVASPNPGTNVNSLFSVARVPGSNHLWAVGSADNIPGALIEYYNGSSWSVVASPSLPAGSMLSSVTVLSATNAWAVGDTYDNNGNSLTLVEQYNGSTWSRIASPNVKGSSMLSGVASVSAHNIWAVGQASIPSAPANPTLIEHFNGTSWSIVSSPSPSASNSLSGVARIPGTSHLLAVGGSGNAYPAPYQTLSEFYCSNRQ